MFRVSQRIFPYKVPARAKECLHGGELFEGNETLISCLKIDNKGGVSRFDFCLKCWKGVKKEYSLPHWKNKFPLPKEKKPLTKDECALEVVRIHIDNDDIESKQICFLSVLYLERNQQLVLRKDLGRKKDALNYYEVAQTGEIFGILPVIIDTKVKERVEVLLEEQTLKQ
jgi:hypothetical protein